MRSVVGLVVLYALAAWRRSAELSRVTRALTVLLAGPALAVYCTGEPTEERLEHLPGFDEGLVQRHERAAMVATVAFLSIGLVAAALLARYRRRDVPNGIATLGLAAALLTAGLMTWTAALGGQIRHTELRGAGTSVAPHGDADER